MRATTARPFGTGQGAQVGALEHGAEIRPRDGEARGGAEAQGRARGRALRGARRSSGLPTARLAACAASGIQEAAPRHAEAAVAAPPAVLDGREQPAVDHLAAWGRWRESGCVRG